MNTKRQEYGKIVEGSVSTTEFEHEKWNNHKDFSSRKISFRISKKNTSYFRAGDYGRKRVHLFSNNKENDRHTYELYYVDIHPRTTHSNKLTCFIKENERIIYTGKNVR
ncbi:hypothetical protein ACQ0QQ_03035 [Lysinibacillus sphaericus]